jgi:hypothetical protein
LDAAISFPRATKQAVAVGHETLSARFGEVLVQPGSAAVQADTPPVGFAEVNSLPPLRSAAKQKVEVGHKTCSTVL